MTPLEWFAIGLSLRVALASVLLTLPVAVAVAFCLVRYRVRGRSVLEALLMAPLVVPPLVTGYLLLVAVGPNSGLGTFFRALTGSDLAFSASGAVLAAAVVSFPLVYRPVKTAIEGIDPRYALVSRSLGVGRFRTFLRVTLPLAWPGVLSGVVLGFARSLGEFGATIMVAGNIPYRTTTVPLAIFSAFNQRDGEAAAARLVLVSLGISVVALVASEWLSRRARRA
jgi:molybdate transport system permease protein